MFCSPDMDRINVESGEFVLAGEPVGVMGVCPHGGTMTALVGVRVLH
jgi:septal ring factor EnvC (AmiA/AmiB activator)